MKGAHDVIVFPMMIMSSDADDVLRAFLAAHVSIRCSHSHPHTSNGAER